MTFFDDHQSAYRAELLAAYDASELDGDGIPMQRGNSGALDPLALGYGSDLYCTTDVRPDFSQVPPDSPEAVGQSATRFLLGGGVFTDREWNDRLGDEGTGAFDLYGMLSIGTTSKDLAAAIGIARAMLMQYDDRIAKADLQIELLGSGRFRVSLDIDLKSGDNWSDVFVLTSARVPQ